MQEVAEEGRRPMFRKGREPALEPGSAGAHEDSHLKPLFGAFIASEEGRGMIPTGQEEEGEDQRITCTSQSTTDSSRRTIFMIREITGPTQ